MSDPEIVIMGAPGAGKGTQSDHIAEEFDVDHVSTGDAFRANKDMDISDLGLEYDTPAGFMDAGELVPDEVVNEILRAALEDADGYVLDGYPRNLAQVEYLDSVADPDVVLYLEVDEDVLTERLTGRRVCSECGATYHVDFDPPEEEGVCDVCGGDLYQREDDQPDTVKERIRVYRDETAPVVDHYDDTGLLVRVDGEGTPDEVWADLRAAIEDALEG
ncbi:adenylate kinase [Halobacteriales archaeon QS_8_69_26]|nr:MAG: adenylate kinase [Halobacteriales archaeon QS_8_69_26]